MRLWRMISAVTLSVVADDIRRYILEGETHPPGADAFLLVQSISTSSSFSSLRRIR